MKTSLMNSILASTIVVFTLSSPAFGAQETKKTFKKYGTILSKQKNNIAPLHLHLTKNFL